MNSNNKETPPSSSSSSPAYILDQYSVKGGPAANSNTGDSPFYQSKAPSINLPKGGGALKGIDEKFSVNAVNGTASLSVAFPFSPGRSGFTPSLSLSYNSGGGNSAFGLGWELGLPSIQRRTDKKLPLYRDDIDSDVFMLSGAEDLVPVLVNGVPLIDTSYTGYTVKHYKPRIEGLHARIELISAAGGTYKWWRVITKDNTVTYYGLTPGGRLCDPEDDRRIFQWLPELSIDNKGNAQHFIYKDENADEVPFAVHERNRRGVQPVANKYLKRVRYCNEQPFFVNNANVYAPVLPSLNDTFWMEGVLDYGEHGTMPGDTAYDNPVPDPGPSYKWLCRSDAFSRFQPGFEIRTWRKCRRVLFFHYFRELNASLSVGPVLVRSLDFTYASGINTDLREADYITAIGQNGYKGTPGNYVQGTLPAMSMSYEPLAWSSDLKDVSPDNAANAPQGLTGNHQWIDLWGEGLPGILTEQGNGWFYKSNLGDARFTPAAAVAEKPSFRGLGEDLQWQDLDADGRRQVVSHSPGIPGYFELNDDQQWEQFVPFESRANVNMNSPYTKMLDLDGDGRPDMLVTEDRVWTWYANKGTKGFDSGGMYIPAADDEKGPRLVLNDSVQRIFLADMNGDGMTDLVRITNGEICYWPNMGYGLFGAKVTMSNAPVFSAPDLYNPIYLTLADISGTGAADLIYLGRNKCTAYINLAGNGWSAGYDIAPLPSVEPYSRIAILDFLGNGTGCMVWSSPLPQHSHAPLRYIDLMGGRKPYLMKSYDNGMGKTVSVTYKSSSQFYAADKLAGRPWATRLPFPVQCISEIVTHDSVSDTWYTQQYRYRHGYYDHEEREFRGFGYVETMDTDTAVAYKHAVSPPENDLNQPPVLTKTWYHTGAWLREGTLLQAFKSEYYHFDGWNDLETQATLPGNLNAQELREAHRALKGLPLRREVYALNDRPADPYTVTVNAYCVRMEQEQGPNRYASFYAWQEQDLAWSCEQDPADARLLQNCTLEIDAYGNILQSINVAYGRSAAYLPTAPELAGVNSAQQQMHVTYTQNSYTTDMSNDGDRKYYRLPLLCDARTFELKGLSGSLDSPLLTPGILSGAVGTASGSIVDFSDTGASGPCLRLLSITRTLFLDDSAGSVLPLHQCSHLAISYQQYHLAFTDTILGLAYNGYVDNSMLAEGGYLRDNEISGFPGDHPEWIWIPTGTVTYNDPVNEFYTPVSYVDPWHNETRVAYWPGYFLLPQVVTLPDTAAGGAGSQHIVEQYDWRILQPVRIRDLNDNFSEIVFDALGLPVAMATKGKDNGTEGDLLEYAAGPDPIDANSAGDITLQGLFWSDPETYAADLLGKATWRCVYDFTSQPSAVAMIGRQRHYNGPFVSPPIPDDTLLRITYTDGLGRVIMHKIQAGTDDDTHYTWIGSGRTIYNNKGNPVMQFEPYYSPGPASDTMLQAAAGGVSSKLYYDPLGRVYRTEQPDGSFSKVEWTNWTQVAYDSSDTLGTWAGQAGSTSFTSASSWHDDRIGGALGPDEKDAAEKAALHAGTPMVIHLDTLGRQVHTVQHDRNLQNNWADDYYHSATDLDINGDRRAIHDARGNTQLQYRYNMVKSPVWQYSIDGGTSRMLTDVAGQPLYGWDAEDRRTRITYDELRRVLAKECNGIILQRTLYGEGQPADRQNNLRGQVYAQREGAQLSTHEQFDFKYQPLYVTTTFTRDADVADVDWTTDPTMEGQRYDAFNYYDALGRITETQDVAGNHHYHLYNRTGLLQQVIMKENGTVTLTWYVKDIHYNAKGQRSAIWYGNGTKTSYLYDTLTYRLRRLTTRNVNSGNPHYNELLQDLDYYYDPVGNITRLRDDAQQDIFYNNALVAPVQDYTYDALYRLVAAAGREQIGISSFGGSDNYDDSAWTNIPHKGDWNALQNYTQYYTYDSVGNITELNHCVGGFPCTGSGSYTRTYSYDSASNRLWNTTVSGQTYDYYNGGNGYDAHGNMLYMPHLVMGWNLQQAMSYAGNGTYGTYYQYTGGQRVRKYLRKSSGDELRYYLGNVEIYRRYDNGGSLVVERTTTHIADDTGRIAMIEVCTQGSDASAAWLARYIYSNHLGSASLELTEKGDVISYEEYHPYGTTSYQAMEGSVKATAKRYRYTGKERDEESGLYYHGARYYAPWIARWTAVDPLEDKYAGWSGYHYVKCNPVVDTDSTGMGGDGDPWGQQFSASTSQVGIKLFFNGKQEWGVNLFAGISGTASTKFISAEGGLRLGVNLMGSFKGVSGFHYDVTANWFTGFSLGATWKNNNPTHMGNEFSFAGTGVPSNTSGYTYGIGGVGIFSNKFKGQNINTYMGTQYAKIGLNDVNINLQHTNDGMVVKEFTKFIIIPPLLGFRNTDWHRTTELDFSLNVKGADMSTMSAFYHASLFTPAPEFLANGDRKAIELQDKPQKFNSATGKKEYPQQYVIDPKSHGVWFHTNQLGFNLSSGGQTLSLSMRYGDPQPVWQDKFAHGNGYRFPGWNLTGEHQNQAKQGLNVGFSNYSQTIH